MLWFRLKKQTSKNAADTTFNNNGCKEYFGTAEGEFILRYNMLFRHKKRVNDTELSKYLWKLKEENVDHNLEWSIKAYASP